MEMEWERHSIKWKPIFEALKIKPLSDPVLIPEGRPKVLVVCQGGNVRSVGAAFLLKYKYWVDALAVSWERNSKLTLYMLCEDWADLILIMDENSWNCSFLQKMYPKRTVYFQCGTNTWWNDVEFLVDLDKQLASVIKERFNIVPEEYDYATES